MGKKKRGNKRDGTPNQPFGKELKRASQARFLPTNRGVVVRVFEQKQFGFLKLKDKLNDDEGEDIFFHFDRVSCGFLQPIIGDVIEFTLNKKTEKGPSVFRGKFVEGKRRGIAEVNKFFEKVQRVVLNVDCEDEQSTQNQDIIKILGCSTAWECILKSIENSGNVENLMMIIKLFDSNLKSMKGHFKNTIYTIVHSPFMALDKGPFKSYITDIVENDDKEAFSILSDFLLLIVRYVPDKARKIVKLIAPVAENSSQRGVFFYEILKSVTSTVSSSAEALDWNELPLVPTNEEIKVFVIIASI